MASLRFSHGPAALASGSTVDFPYYLLEVACDGENNKSQGLRPSPEAFLVSTLWGVLVPNPSLRKPWLLTRTRTRAQRLRWLEELHADGTLRNVPGFGIGAQAVAALYKEKLPALPDWCAPSKPGSQWAYPLAEHSGKNEEWCGGARIPQ